MDNEAKFYEDRFIARWVAGQLTDTEQSEFHNWIAANPHEKSRFDEFLTLWKKSRKIRLRTDSGNDTRWQNLEATLHASGNSPKKISLKAGFLFFAIILGIGFILLNLIQTN